MGDTNQVSPCDSVQGVTSGTNLTVNLETSSDGCMVEGLEHTVVRPSVSRRMQTVLGSGHSIGSHGVLVQDVRGTKTNSGGGGSHGSLGPWGGQSSRGFEHF